MPPKDMIEIQYLYLKGKGWKNKTEIIREEDLQKYLNNKEYRVIKHKKIKV